MNSGANNAIKVAHTAPTRRDVDMMGSLRKSLFCYFSRKEFAIKSGFIFFKGLCSLPHLAVWSSC